MKKVWESRVCVMMRREGNIYICGNNALRQYYQQCRKLTFQKQKMDVLNLMNKHDLIYTIAKAQILWKNKDSKTVLITTDVKCGQGWVRKEVERKSGKSTGAVNKYWYTPMKCYILQSLKEVEAFKKLVNEQKTEDIAYALLKCKFSQNT